MNPDSSYMQAVARQREPGREAVDGLLDLRDLVRLGTLAASSHNTQPWIFRLGERSLSIHPDFERRCPVVDPDDAHLWKSLGCAAENIVQAAAAQAHAADVTFDEAGSRLLLRFEPSASMRPTPLSAAIPRRQSTRRPYDGRPIPPRERDLLEAAGTGEGVRVLLIDDPRRREDLVELVREGDIAQLGDPAFRRELVSWLRFNDRAALATGDGLASRPAGQPQIPEFLARFVIGLVLRGRAQADLDARNMRSSPLVAVFLGEADTVRQWVEAGRAYERFALQASALGLRTAHLNQPIEVRALRPRLASALATEGVPLLILRVGYGPEAPFSLRRPVEQVIRSGPVS